MKGEKFQGSNCLRNHGGERYVSNKVCVVCQRIGAKNWSANNPQKLKASYKKYSSKESRKQGLRDWGKKNRYKTRMWWARYDTAKVSATPIWLNKDDWAQISDFYEKAVQDNLTVDHIIPIRGKHVCGLHVPWNLQLLTGPENSAKGNRYE